MFEPEVSNFSIAKRYQLGGSKLAALGTIAAERITAFTVGTVAEREFDSFRAYRLAESAKFLD